MRPWTKGVITGTGQMRPRPPISAEPLLAFTLRYACTNSCFDIVNGFAVFNQLLLICLVD